MTSANRNSHISSEPTCQVEPSFLRTLSNRTIIALPKTPGAILSKDFREVAEPPQFDSRSGLDSRNQITNSGRMMHVESLRPFDRRESDTG